MLVIQQYAFYAYFLKQLTILACTFGKGCLSSFSFASQTIGDSIAKIQITQL